MEPEALCFRVGRPSVRVCSCEGLLRPAYRRHLVSQSIGNESVPIQLAQCRFPGLAISNAKMFQKNVRKQFHQAALGNCYGLKLAKC